MGGLGMPLLGGVLIGLSSVLLWGTLGQTAGISGITTALLPPFIMLMMPRFIIMTMI